MAEEEKSIVALVIDGAVEAAQRQATIIVVQALNALVELTHEKSFITPADVLAVAAQIANDLNTRLQTGIAEKAAV